MKILGQTVRSESRVSTGRKNSTHSLVDAQSYHLAGALQRNTSFVETNSRIPLIATERATIRPHMNYRPTSTYLATLRSSASTRHVALVIGTYFVNDYTRRSHSSSIILIFQTAESVKNKSHSTDPPTSDRKRRE